MTEKTARYLYILMIPPYIKTNIIHFSFPTHHAFLSSNEYLLNIISSQLDWHHSQRLPEHYWRESVDAAETEGQKASSPHWAPPPCHNRKDGYSHLRQRPKTAQPLYTKIKWYTEIPNTIHFITLTLQRQQVTWKMEHCSLIPTCIQVLTFIW